MTTGYYKFRLKTFLIMLMIVFVMIMTILFFVPMQDLGSIGPFNADKVYHFIAFFCLVFPLSFASPRSILWLFFGAIFFGGAIELAQHLFGRRAEWADFLANGIGVILGMITARFLRLWYVRAGGLNGIDDKQFKDI
jgi:hypothetical protein